jgi:rhomboid protease GluP
MGFAIRYLPRPPNPWGLVGRGEIEPAGAAVILRGRKTFFLGGRQSISIPRERVSNVAVQGKLLSCEVTSEGDKPRPLQFLAGSAADAAEIARLLPQEASVQFKAQQAERAAYQESLDSRRALVTPVLIGINVAVFIAMALRGVNVLAPSSAMLLPFGSNFGPYTLDGQWWRLFTAMFLHFGIAHLAFNMLGLWSLGKLTERLFGSARYLFLYLFAGLCGSCASLLWHPMVNSAGASGAIFGVLGALLAFMVNPRTRIPAHIAAAQRNSALIFIAYNLFNGFAHAGIDNAAHIGGLLAGFAMGWLLARPLDAGAAPQRRQMVLALLGGVAVLGSLWGWLAYPPRLNRAERDFRQLYYSSMRSIIALETDQARFGQLASAGKISDRELADRVAGLQTGWRVVTDLISASPLPAGSRFEAPRATMESWARERSEALRDLAAGLRGRNKSAVELAVIALKDNEQQEPQIAAISGQLN